MNVTRVRYSRAPVDEKAGSLAAAVVQGSVDGFAVIDRETRYQLWNAAMARFSGKSADEVLGRRAFDVFPHLRDHGLDVAIQRALAGETVDGVAYVEPDGTRKVYDRLYVPLREPSRTEISGVIAIVRDATARYVAQEALRTTAWRRRRPGTRRWRGWRIPPRPPGSIW